MLAVGPSELTKILLQELAKDVAMRWDKVTDKHQEFLGRSLCRTPQGYKFEVSRDYVTQLCNTLSFEEPADNVIILYESGQRQLLGGYSGWIVLTSRTQFVNCPLASAQPPLVMKSTSSDG